MSKTVKKTKRFTAGVLCLVISFCTFANKVQAQADSLLLISDGMDCEMLPMKKQKSGSYTPFGYIKSTDYAVSVLGDGAIFSSSNPHSKFYTLFPDSLTVSYIDYLNEPDSNRRETHYPAIGFVFDPYSRAYDTAFKKRLFYRDSYDDGVCDYRIDTLFVLGQYRMANYNPLSPDTLRIFLSYYNAYYYPDGVTVDPKRGTDYFRLFWSSDTLKGMGFVSPIVNYGDRNNIPPKGAVTRPAGETTKTINYILSDKDSVNLSNGLVGYKAMVVPIQDYLGRNYEVPVSSVTSVIMKYIPGYNYNDRDTILKTSYTYPNTWVAEDVRENVFVAAVIDNPDFAAFFDKTGAFNCHLMEDMNIRYDGANNDRDSAPSWNPNHHQMYSIHYNAIPYLYMFVSTGEYWHSISEHTNSFIRIYPNPTNSQLRITDSELPIKQVELYSIVGNLVQTIQVDDYEVEINMQNLQSGVYYVKITTNNGVITRKIIKQ